MFLKSFILAKKTWTYLSFVYKLFRWEIFLVFQTFFSFFSIKFCWYLHLFGINLQTELIKCINFPKECDCNAAKLSWKSSGCLSWRKGTLNCKLYCQPMFYKHTLSFVGLKTLGIFYKKLYSKEGVILLNIIGNVQFTLIWSA